MGKEVGDGYVGKWLTVFPRVSGACGDSIQEVPDPTPLVLVRSGVRNRSAIIYIQYNSITLVR